MIRNAKWNYFRSFSVANSGDLWKTIKHLYKRPTQIADLNLHDGNVTSTPAEKASALNPFFATCFNQSFPHLTNEELATTFKSFGLSY